MKEYKIDHTEVTYVVDSLLSGKTNTKAVTQRISRSLKRKDFNLYLSLKLAQALAFYTRKVHEDNLQS